MPYHRRYYKKRNVGRRYKNRTFTRFNTYKNRSSKAQAYQIYKLNKKVNRVYKLTKPEVQIYTDDKYNNNGQASVEMELNTSHLSGYNLGITQLIGKNNHCFNGRYARIRDFTLTGSFEFIGNPQEVLQQQVCGLRVILFRIKADQYAAPIVSDAIDVKNDKNNAYYMNSPLPEGFSTRFKLVADRKYYIKPELGPAKCFKIHCKYPYSLRSMFGLDVNPGQSQNACANTLYCVWYICRLGTFTGSSVDNFTGEMYLKFAYTDDTHTQSIGAKNVDEKNEDVDEDVDENK